MRLPTFRRKKDPSPSSVPVPSSSTLALRRSPSSASPSPSGSSSNLPANPRRHALDSSTNVYKPTTRSSPIPRGNGHQALSIPMPPPPSLYFSLLPSGANAATSTTATTSGGAGSTSSSTKSARTPRPSLGQHASVRDNSDSDISISRPRPKSKSTMTNLRPKQLHPQSDSSTSTVPPSLSFTPLVRMNSHSSSSTPRSAPNSRPSSNPTTPGIGPVPAAAHAGGYDHHHTHHHAPRSTFPLSMTHSRRSSLSHVYEPSTTASGRMQKPGGFFDMAIFDPAPEHLPRSARASIDHDGQSRRVPVSRPPSIESINSANSVPFAPPPPPPPSVWKQFTSHFSHRVVKRHIKFIVALYISSAMALVPSISRALGTSPYMANVAVVFMHPSRTVGSQLEVTIFSVIGGVLAAVWILPCQVATAAFNQKYLPDGNNSAWAIDAAWFFVGVWIMTSYKARYAKLNCSFIIYTIAGIFALTRNHTSMHFDFHDFWGLMGPMMLGVGICLVVSILLWPETASEGLGRALNESLDTSRALLTLSTRFFLLNHNTIALPKSAIEKAQAEVRTAQKKLFSAYREARYEVTYSMTNPADYKEVRLIISALMRHLGSMSLVVQNERLLMLGHPDRDDQDLVSQSGSELSYPSSASDTESDDGASESEADHPSSGTTNNNDSGEKIHHQSDYFGDAIAEGAEQRTSRRSRHGRHNDQLAESPTSEDGHSTPRKRVQRRGSAAELRRIRQLLQRAENSTQATMKARQRHQERLQKDALQQPFQFGRDGTVTAPPTPGGRGVFNVFGHHQAHRSRTLTPTRADNDPSTDTPRQYLSTTPSNISTPNSSKPNSIYEEQNLETIKSFKSLFSIKSASKFKPNRPASLKAGFKLSQGKRRKDKSEEGSPRIPLEDMHYATVPENGALGCSNHYTSRNGLLFQTSLTDHQIKKAAESFRKQREKEAARQRKLAEREVKAEQQRAEKQRQAEAAARAVPPKEVAFGDRKLFMSFLDIVHNPLQRLSDSCSRVMVAMERELVAGLNVEQDRLERIRRRNAQRVNTIRAAEAKMTEEGKAGVNGTTTYTDAAGTTAAERELTKKRGFVNTSVLDRIRALVGIKPSHMTKGDLEYVGALKSGMVKDKEKNVKPSKNGVAADTVHPNKFLQQDAQRNATCSGIDDDDEDELMLPPDMSYVQYLSQELEIFDKAEAEGLRDFIATHPTLDVGPREELFLIFFFLFALREIARELLRLGKHMEEIEERERRKMEEDGRTKRRKQLWWPKVFGNFWHWFAWGSYTQVKTSEGHNALVLNTTKNLEHRQPRTIEEEKALVEAKTAKAVAERAAAEASAKAVAERKAEHRRRRHSEMWDLPPLRRAITLSAFVHRKTSEPDLELGPVEDDHQDENRRFRRSAHGHLQGLRSRSNSPFRSSTAWSRHCEVPQHYGSPKQWTHNETDLGDPSILRGKEVLDNEFGEEEAGSPSRTIPESLASTKSRSKRAEQYTVVEIPDFKSLQLRDDQDLKHFEDVNVIDLMPRVNGLKLRNTAPPELDIAKHSKSKKSHQQTSGSRSPRNVILSAPSSTHQDRYPSFACSTPPSLLPGHHESDSTFVDSHGTGLRAHILNDRTDDHNDRRSSTESGGSAKDHHRRGRYGKDAKAGKSRFRGVFSPFSCSTSNEGSKNTPKQRQRQLHPASEPIKPARTTFVSVNKPKTLRYRFWEFLQPFKSEDFKFGFKMAVALTFIGLWSWLQWNSVALATDRGQWAMITVMAVLSPTVGATFSVCAMRIAGTLIGTLWALLTFLALPKNPYVICAMMLVIAFAGVFLILESAHPKLGIIMLLSYSSITFIMYEGHTTETIYQVCYKRAITVIIGIIISVIMNSLLWPILARRELRKEIAILIGRQGVLFAELVNKFLLEDPQDKKQGAQSHYAANWPQQDDLNGYASDELNEETLQREDPEEDQFQDSFVERAEREARMQKQQQQAGRGRRRSGSYDQKSGTTGGSNGDSGAAITDGLQHQTEDSRNAMDPDRLAFQHVEHQLQTKLIKISELLELSGSEPRLKEEFPMKLYNQIVQCCQNILDRMISMRMAAQLLSPEVRELVTGPMNYYRRDMVGALLLYFSVLSSSLASKSALPPYLPSARIARLRVIYNVRETIAAHQAMTGEDHYTYIYYYAFSSALEEVIEELELLAILIKPLVGVTMVSSGNCYAYGMPEDQLNLGSAIATSQLGLPPLSGSDLSAASGGSYEQHAGLQGNLSRGVLGLSRVTSTMVNIGASSSTTAGTETGAFGFGQQLQYPQDMLYQQQRRLEQQQAEQQQQQLLLHRKLQMQQKQIEQQQQLLQQRQLGLDFHPDLTISPATRILINPQIIPSSTVNPAATHRPCSSTASLPSGDLSDSSDLSHKNKKEQHGGNVGPSSSARHPTKGKKRIEHKMQGGDHQTHVSPPTPGVHPSRGSTVEHTKVPHASSANCMGTSSILMMDESLLGNRHAQRYREAIQAAQEASGQQVIEIPSAAAAVVPAKTQLPLGASSSSSATKAQHTKETLSGVTAVALPKGDHAATGSGNKRPSLTGSIGYASISDKHHSLCHHHRRNKSQDSTQTARNGVSPPETVSTDASPYRLALSPVVVTPFGSGMIPEAPLPLHMIPVQNIAERETRDASHRPSHHGPQHGSSSKE